MWILPQFERDSFETQLEGRVIFVILTLLKERMCCVLVRTLSFHLVFDQADLLR